MAVIKKQKPAYQLAKKRAARRRFLETV